MLYERHVASPGPEVFSKIRLETPNMSGRMDHLRAAILRPQLRQLVAKCDAWNERYRIIEAGIQGTPGLTTISRDARENFVGSSIQFLLKTWSDTAVQDLLNRCATRGVELKWFGAADPVGFTSTYKSWNFAPNNTLPQSDAVLAGLIDMRIPLTFSLEDCATIAKIIRSEVAAVFQNL